MKKPEYIIGGLFPVPTIKIKFKQHDKYNFPLVAKKDAKPSTWEGSLNTTFPNIIAGDDFISMEKTGELKTDISNAIIPVFNEINISTKFAITDFWYNIYHQNQGQERHDHLGPLNLYWCGIYYNKNASPTVFCNRREGHHATHVHQVPDHASSKLEGLFKPNAVIPTMEGDIILFPPYLEHFVPEQKNIVSDDNMRVTFSFNLLNTNIHILKEEENDGITS